MRSPENLIKMISVKVLFVLLLSSSALYAENSSKYSYITSFNDTTSNLLKVFPSSAKLAHKTVLTFTLANPQKVAIKIYDVDGREVAYLMERNVPAGTFEILLETKNLKKGMYFCKFFTEDRIPMKKMIMVK